MCVSVSTPPPYSTRPSNCKGWMEGGREVGTEEGEGWNGGGREGREEGMGGRGGKEEAREGGVREGGRGGRK